MHPVGLVDSEIHQHRRGGVKRRLVKFNLQAYKVLKHGVFGSPRWTSIKDGLRTSIGVCGFIDKADTVLDG